MLSRRNFVKVTVLFAAAAAARQASWPPLLAAPPSGGLELLCFGDYGFEAPDQKRVAERMTEYVRARSIRPDALLLLGDNFYGTLPGGVKDPRWKRQVEDMYPRDPFDCPFHAILGNHDYDDMPGLAEIELAYAAVHPGTRWNMPAPWYRLDLPAKAPVITLLCLQSHRKVLTPAQEKEQVEWVNRELAERPPAGWLAFLGHHPLFSNGYHGDNRALIDLWGPLLQKHGVHLYLAGHDHDLQHLKVEGYPCDFFISGGGGAPIRPPRDDRYRQFYDQAYGFLHLSVTPDALAYRFIDDKGRLVYTHSRPKA